MRKKALEESRALFHKKYKRLNYWLVRAEFQMMLSHSVQTDIVGFEFDDCNVSLTYDGLLTVKELFIFGASGPTVDTKNSREGSCFHDALYYISQEGGFKVTVDGAKPDDALLRKKSDELIRDICIKNGMSKLRAYTWYYALRLGGKYSWKA